MNFRRWLIKQCDRCDNVGGLGVLAYLDRDFPSMASWREYKNYLYGRDNAEGFSYPRLFLSKDCSFGHHAPDIMPYNLHQSF
jgi:hypothetical protein